MYKIPKLLKIGFFFKPFLVSLPGKPLAETNLPPVEELILVERNRHYRLLLPREMAYHHVAQGELAGEPFLVTF